MTFIRHLWKMLSSNKKDNHTVTNLRRLAPIYTYLVKYKISNGQLLLCTLAYYTVSIIW